MKEELIDPKTKLPARGARIRFVVDKRGKLEFYTGLYHQFPKAVRGVFLVSTSEYYGAEAVKGWIPA